MQLRAYMRLASLSFKRAVAYPFEIWSMLANNLIRLTLFLSVWSLLLHSSQDRPLTLAYVTTVYFMDAVNFASYTWMLPMEIRSGNIAMGLLKPISQPMRLLWEQWGENMVYLLQGVPVYAAAWVFLPVPWPSIQRLALFWVSATLGNLIYVLVFLAVATASFWTLRTNGTVWAMNVGWNVLSGKVVPLWFMPAGLRGLAEWLPFSQAYHVPAAILTGALQGTELVMAVARQVMWVGLASLAVHLLWTVALRRVVVQGG